MITGTPSGVDGVRPHGSISTSRPEHDRVSLHKGVGAAATGALAPLSSPSGSGTNGRPPCLSHRGTFATFRAPRGAPFLRLWAFVIGRRQLGDTSRTRSVVVLARHSPTSQAEPARRAARRVSIVMGRSSGLHVVRKLTLMHLCQGVVEDNHCRRNLSTK
jgi:hypothetical protein